MSQSRTARRSLPRTAAGTAAAAATIAAAALLTGCGGSGGGAASAGGSGTQFVKGTGEITAVEPAERKTAPAVSGRTVQGRPLSLGDYEGKVIVLNVWGSWCAPCRAEAKNLAKVAADTEDQGVQFIGINTRDLDTANAEAFERGYRIGYPSLFDPSGRLVLKFKDSMSPQAIPSTLILDRQGRIAVRALKALGEEDLRKALAPVIAEKS